MGPYTMIERIRVEYRADSLVFSVQYPSHNPAHGAFLGGPPVIHEERIECRSGNLDPLLKFVEGLLPKPQ